MCAGGPKLRKWYGEGELPADGGSAVVEKMPEPEDIPPEAVKRDAILVTDADSPTGEQVVLQLILARYLFCRILRLSMSSFVDCCSYASQPLMVAYNFAWLYSDVSL